MGGLISVIVCVLAAVAFVGTGHPILLSLSVAAGIVCFWSWGVMHNYATVAAKRRHDIGIERMRLSGVPEEEITRFDSRIVRPGPEDIDAVPNWLTTVNMVAAAVGIVLLVWGAIIRLT